MANFNNTQVVKFSTTAINEDIMQNATVSAKIKAATGLSTADYATEIANGGIRMSFTLFFEAANTVKLNTETVANDLIEDAVYSTDSATVKNIYIGLVCDATLMFDLE